MKFRRGFTSLARAAAVVLLAATLAACQGIPDISKWDKATQDVSSAVTQGFQSSAQVNGEMAKRLDKVLEVDDAFRDPARRYGEAAKALRTRADDYEKLFGAMADYSASLAALAQASANSGKTVDGVASSLNSLVGALGGVPLAGASLELGKTLASEIIKIKAASDFADAVQKADPVIGLVAELVLRDLADLRRTVAPSKDEAITAAITTPVRRQLAYRSALLRRRVDLQTAITTIAPVAASGTQPATRSLLSINDAPELARVEQYLRDADAWYLPMQSELDKALLARARAEELVVQTGRAIEAWRASHATLAAAAREKRAPDTGRLVAVTLRIRSLLDDMRKEK
jgi:hypothetical protein